MSNKSKLLERAEELDISGSVDMGKKQLRKAVEAAERELETPSRGWVPALVAILVGLALSAFGYYRHQHSVEKS